MKNLIQTPANVLVFFLVKLGLYRQTVAEKIITARRIIERMTGNANFTDPVPTLPEFEAVTDELEAAEAAMDGSALKTEQRDIAEAAFDAAIKQLQSYVNTAANGSVEVALSSGMDVRDLPTKATVLQATEAIKAAPTGISGQIKVKWKPIKGARIYMIFQTMDINTENWQLIGESTKASLLVENLTPGKVYYYRVVGINAAGVGAESQPATAMSL